MPEQESQELQAAREDALTRFREATRALFVAADNAARINASHQIKYLIRECTSLGIPIETLDQIHNQIKEETPSQKG